ncbi:MAG: putative phosphosugar isomerase [Bacteroidetes bacterium]|nr:putative phosphosugar isomerase [Bacteroidota bacterium]
MTSKKTLSAEATEKTISVAKKIVEVVGVSLGNLIVEIYQGKIENDKWNEDQKNIVKGTKYFIIGGSIGTNGYTKAILPLWAKKKIKSELKDKNDSIVIIPSGMDSFNAGSLGASYALSKGELNNIQEKVKDIYKTKIPILPLIDVGGTKINFVLAHFDVSGELNNNILESYDFPTPVFSDDKPQKFYESIVSYIYPILKRFDNSNYEIIKVMAIGHPGKFDNSQGKIIDGAKDIGFLIGQCPCELMHEAFQSYGISDYTFYFCNDGTAQFYGLLRNIKKSDPNLWTKLENKQAKIMYLGIGTGLGIGHGHIEDGKLVVHDEIRDANGIKIQETYKKYLYENYNVIRKVYGGDNKTMVYGQIVSSKLFHRYMHEWELQSLKKGKASFLNYTGINAADQSSLVQFVDAELQKYNKGIHEDNMKSPSPLSAKLINTILKDEINTSQSEILFEIQKDELKSKLNASLQIFSREIKNKLGGNINNSDYIKIIEEIVLTKKRGNIVHFVGIGKSYLIGKNLSYIYNNLGIRSSYIELTGANSENLTSLRQDDLVFLISNSGKTCELLNILPHIQKKGCITIALTGDNASYLKKKCDFVIYYDDKHCENPLNIREAPTTSTTLALVAGTAISIVVSCYFDYSAKDFYLDHPGLEFDDNVKFEDVKSDVSFNPYKKLQEIFESFSEMIAQQNKFKNKRQEEFSDQIISLAKQILISHNNKRTIFITGSGASYKVAEKVSATLTSIGIDASIVNPSQLPHGDFAHIQKGDLLIVLSYSGNTKDLIKICEIAQEEKEAKIALITSGQESVLSKIIKGQEVNIKEIDDSKLVLIPDQKIMSSCINLVVGDVLAIILAEVLQTSKTIFAQRAHPFGEISRQADMNNKELLKKHATLTKYVHPYFDDEDMSLCKFNNIYDKDKCEDCIYPKKKYCALQKEALVLLNRHLEQVDQAKYSYSMLLDIFNKELTVYNENIGRPSYKTGKVLVIGAGSIGLTYIARILNKSNKILYFIEKEKQRVKNLLSIDEYVLDASSSDRKRDKIIINQFSVFDSNDIETISIYALTNNLVFVAIGLDNRERTENRQSLIKLIKFIVLRRYSYGIQVPINFVFNENFELIETPLAKLRYEISNSLESPDVKRYFLENVGLVPAIDEVLAPSIAIDDNFTNPLKIEPEIAPVYINKKEWKEWDKDHNEISDCSEMCFVNDFYAYHMRKLWIHNMAHFLIAIRAKEKGITTVWRAILDKEIKQSAHKAINLVGQEIYKRWAFEKFDTLKKYENWLLSRYQNKGLNDQIDRVIRDPERKLEINDRLIGPLNFIYKYGDIKNEGYTEIIKAFCLAIKLRAQILAEKSQDAHWEVIYKRIRNEIKNNKDVFIDFEEVAKVENILEIKYE